MDKVPVCFLLLRRGPSAELIEDVVGALWGIHRHHSGPLQQVCVDAGTRHAASPIKVDLHKFPEARGVVIPHSLGIAKGFQQWIGFEHLHANTCVRQNEV